MLPKKTAVIAGVFTISLFAYSLIVSGTSARTLSTVEGMTDETTTVTSVPETSKEIVTAITEPATEVTTNEITTPTPTPTTTTTTTTVVTTTAVTTTTEKQKTKLTVSELTVEANSVSSFKVEWKPENDRYYKVSCEGVNYGNTYFSFRDNNICYINGLRENEEYTIEVTPILTEEEEEHAEDFELIPVAVTSRTQAVEVIQEFPYEEGWTYCFAGERASGLTKMPSSGAIYGSEVDETTNTGIRRFENGDYCCAMGLFYGVCNDRFLVELENGIQFTVRICDSKGWCDDADMNGWIGDDIDRDTDGDGIKDADGDGVPDGRFHWFGGAGNGKCVIEFIYDDYNLPSCVSYSGSWGYYNWEGLNLCSNIASIKKINY